jgi:hypothetical protein
MSKVETFLWGMIVGILMHTGVQLVLKNRLEDAAYQCAVMSEGTDSAIEACYTERKLPFPGH